MYEYSKSIKSSISDEPTNTYLLRPVAGLIVRVLYKTPVTPNQVTIASTLVGIIAAIVYLRDDASAIACAGLLVTVKDVLDSADGQLARVKQQYSRDGRFLDSIGDFMVDLAIFGAIGWMLSVRHGTVTYGVMAFLGLVGLTLRVSYHVFYHSSFLHLEDKYQMNRVTEEVREEDKKSDRITLVLQKVFQAIYGWQDRFILRIDEWCLGSEYGEDVRKEWYSDYLGIRLSGFVGLGTELFVLTLSSLFNSLELYLYLNLFLMNGVLLTNVLYRRFVLRAKLAQKASSAPH